MTLDQRMQKASNEVRDTFNERTGSPVAQVARRNRALGFVTALAATAVVTMAVGTVALNSVSQPDAPATGTQVPPVTAISTPEQPEAVVATNPDAATLTYDGFIAVRQDPVTGDFIGIRDFGIYRSTDNGETWIHIYGGMQGDDVRQIEALDVSPDGAIVAIENLNDIHRDTFGPNSVFNDPPLVHMYDPATNEWAVTELPRPELPVAGLAPAPMDGSGTCEIGGLKSWVDGVAVAFGEQIAIVGSQRVTGEGICDEDFPFLWTSTDGTEWTIIPDTGTESYLTGLTWAGDVYVAYGSDRPSYVGASIADFEDAYRSLNILTSTDLLTWIPIAVDLSVLPGNVLVSPGPSTSGNPGLHMAGPVPTSNGTLALVFPTYSMAPRPGTDLVDIGELVQWLKENGYVRDTETPERVSEFLYLFGIDFPLDADETELLWSFYGGSEGLAGRLLVERTTDGQWSTSFSK